MMRAVQRLTWVVLGVALLAVLGGLLTPGATPLRTVADLSRFDPGNIISDAVFFDDGAMGAAEIQAFLEAKGASCTAGSDGTACLKNYRQDTTTRAADAYCSGYQAGAGESAARIIAKVATSCGINPQVLLVMLQKEQGLVTATTVNATRYWIAMGFACPDTAACDPAYAGFQNQVYSAARRFQVYAANPASYQYRAGRTSPVLYNPNAACGSAQVAIANQATAGLYIYTPYQPNAAALRAGYGTGDGCSAYGNRNFWLYFTDWFGSTQDPGTSAATMPKGSLDGISSSYGVITAGGWTFDPEAPGRAIEAHLYIDGQFAGAVVANQSRPDVAAAYPAAGPTHGYVVSAPAALGLRQVCVYAINVGAGVVNPQLGCRTVDNQDAGAPHGSVDSAVGGVGVVNLSGWAYDPDAPVSPIAVHVYVDGQWGTALTASGSRLDVGNAFGVGPDHGFSAAVPVAPGTHVVCVYAVNVGPGITNPSLACSSVVVLDPAAYNPVGALDSATVTGGTLRMSGWALDPDVPASPLAVHVYVDGRFAAQVSTAVARPDIVASRPGAGGSTGFGWTTVLPAGAHQVCVFGLNVGAGNWNTQLGCAAVTAVAGAAANPVGSLDIAAGGPGNVRLTGWAFDPDPWTDPVSVHVYLDGAYAGAVTADRTLADPGRVLAGGGVDHGFDWLGTATPGRHRVCAYGLNVGAGTWNPELGCATVTVTDSSPVGALDAVDAGAGTVSVSGWAYDRDATSPVTVTLWSDSTFLAGLPTSGPRPDVATAIAGAGPATGFSWQGPVAPGAHSVCAYAVNVGPGSAYTALGCRTVSVR